MAIHNCVSKMKKKITNLVVEDADESHTPKKHIRPKGRYNHFLSDELKESNAGSRPGLQNFLKTQFLPSPGGTPRRLGVLESSARASPVPALLITVTVTVTFFFGPS